jgi:hypothetical protein
VYFSPRTGVFSSYLFYNISPIHTQPKRDVILLSNTHWTRAIKCLTRCSLGGVDWLGNSQGQCMISPVRLLHPQAAHSPTSMRIPTGRTIHCNLIFKSTTIFICSNFAVNCWVVSKIKNCKHSSSHTLVAYDFMNLSSPSPGYRSVHRAPPFLIGIYLDLFFIQTCFPIPSFSSSYKSDSVLFLGFDRQRPGNGRVFIANPSSFFILSPIFSVLASWHHP